VRREKLQHLIAGCLIAVAVLMPLGTALFVKSGLYNVAASSPHTKFTEWLTHETMIHSVRRRAADIAQPQLSRAAISSGYCEYQTHCVACHGAAGVARQRWASGFEPAPPYLIDINQRFTGPQIFWIVKNGIKMTGMPSWRSELTDAQIWSVVVWLQASAKLPPQTYVQWRDSGRCGERADRGR
jgi:mono/diheme cytochrome c family protein